MSKAWLAFLLLPASLGAQAHYGPTVFDGQVTTNGGLVNLTSAAVSTATYTIPVGQRYTELTGSSAQTITLPTLTTAQAGMANMLIFKGLAANSIVAPTGAIYLNGASFGTTVAVPLRFSAVIDLVWDGTNWYNANPLPDLSPVTLATSTGFGTASVALATTVGSTASAGSFTITTSAAGTAGGTLLTVTFTKTLAAAYIYCQISPTTTVAATNQVLVHIGAFTTTTFTLVDGTTAMPAGAYGYAWHCL